MPPKRSLLVLLVSGAALANGCGGGASGPGVLRIDLPWHKPLPAPPTERATMFWSIGEVTGKSADGRTIQVKVTRGVVSRGDRIGIYVAATDNPSPHYMWDETRELKAAEAKVTQVIPDGFEAEIIEKSTNTAISAGDKVIRLIP